MYRRATMDSTTRVLLHHGHVSLLVSLVTAVACDGGANGTSGPEARSGAEASTPDADRGCNGKLFGTPTERTGLDATRCAPTCTCGGAPYEAPVFDEARLADLRSWTLLDPPDVPTRSPYGAPGGSDASLDGVCGVKVVDAARRTYRVQSYDSAATAERDGGIVTHRGPCGLCSSLHDLAVYAGTPDLTAPVRQCGVDGLQAGFDATVSCLQGLGFSPPCAQIWAYNVDNTREACLDSCLQLLDAPYQLPDGGLNACLLCDEVESGPVFKRVAGRTRRNTGIASALCRPCSEVTPLAHVYE
jgi:hypothetical protein